MSKLLMSDIRAFGSGLSQKLNLKTRMSSNSRLFGIVDAEDGSTKFLRNFGNYLPVGRPGRFGKLT